MKTQSKIGTGLWWPWCSIYSLFVQIRNAILSLPLSAFRYTFPPAVAQTWARRQARARLLSALCEHPKNQLLRDIPYHGGSKPGFHCWPDSYNKNNRASPKLSLDKSPFSASKTFCKKASPVFSAHYISFYIILSYLIHVVRRHTATAGWIPA